MSVALPRPLNTTMNSNIAARPSSSTTPSSTLKARPPTMSSNPNGNGKMAIPSRPPMVSRPSTASTSTASSANGPVPTQAIASGSKDTSSSAGKVFAKPSKEWVLPERAKPGRKVCADEPDNKRQSQNRLSQRAHRARRTDYITTLEDRLRQYEADEIHSNVRLQEVARALKSDNERMKNELMLIKAKMNELYGEKEGWESEKRNLEEMCASLMVEVERLRSGSGSGGGGLKLEPTVMGRTTGSTSITRYPIGESTKENVTKRTPVACPICPDPDPDCPCQQTQTQTQAQQPLPEPHHSDCGLCTTPAECLCRIVNEDPSPQKPTKGKCDVCPSLAICLCEDDTPPPKATPTAALPLRLKLKSKTGGVDKGETKKTFWRLDNVIKKGEAVCSGDPSNCDACKDDTFGKEFCGHLFEPHPDQPIQHKTPCINCPGNCMSINNLLSPAPTNEGFVVDVQPPTPTSQPIALTEEEHETMRCDEAWKKLKAHPNAKFASLALLADVVAGRTKCTGPTIELSPAPTGTPSPIPAHMPPPSIPAARSSPIGVGVHPHIPAAAQTHQVTAGPGIKRRMGVETSAVRDALRILDSTPSRATSEVGTVKAEPIDLDEVNERAAKKIRLD